MMKGAIKHRLAYVSLLLVLPRPVYSFLPPVFCDDPPSDPTKIATDRPILYVRLQASCLSTRPAVLRLIQDCHEVAEALASLTKYEVVRFTSTASTNALAQPLNSSDQTCLFAQPLLSPQLLQRRRFTGRGEKRASVAAEAPKYNTPCTIPSPTCPGLVIFNKMSMTELTVPTKEIKDAAWNIYSECLMSGSRWGGWTTVGDNDDLIIKIGHGADVEQEQNTVAPTGTE